MHKIEIDGQIYTYTEKVFKIPSIDLLDWLSIQEIFPKVFWKERHSSLAYAALGSLFSFNEVPDLPNSERNIRIYGGMSFDCHSKKDPCWQAFPHKKFWLPQMEIVQNEKDTTLLIRNEKSETRVESFIDGSRLKFETQQKASADFFCCKEENFPSAEEWKEDVFTLLNAIEQKKLEKVVLARKQILYTNPPFSGWNLFKKLLKKATHATLFAFEMQPHVLFLGATPEKLFSRRGKLLRADALAGTLPRGKNVKEDLHNEQELLQDPKYRNEFSVVKKFLTSALNDYSEEMRWEGEDKILKNAYVQHLYNQLHATLKSNITNRALIHQLHPTPALGGFPRKEALQYIQQNEPFDRGWYGAPIGVVFPGGASFAVAIRSALIKEKEMHLFSGAGIVSGSDPILEWQEIDQKIHPFTSLIKKEKVAHG